MSVQFHPTKNRVLVALRPLPEKTGSIIRVSRNEYARHADVIAVGPEVRDVTVGQGVLVSTLAGHAVNGQILLPESSILGLLDAAESR